MTGEPGSLPDAKFPRTRSARITAITIRTQKSANTPPNCHNAVARAGRRQISAPSWKIAAAGSRSR